MRGRFPVLSRRLALLFLVVIVFWGVASLAPWPWGEARIVYVKPGMGAWEISSFLKQEGIIRSRFLFMLVALAEGSYTKLHPGEYELSPRMSLLEVLRRLREGEGIVHQVVIPEGFTAREIARTLAAEGLVDEGRFLALVFDPELVKRYGFVGESLEGYLFPDTYYLTKLMPEEEIIRTMVARFRENFGPDEVKRAKALGMSVKDVVTLASLIEKEAKVDQERRLISAVFHNRLKRRMPLQADPSVIYALPDFTGKLTRADLTFPSPYNTYLHRGLPPGPIANPGRPSLLAALYPAKVGYLYFVSKNDGTHFFSRTLEEHNRAVKRYQRGG